MGKPCSIALWEQQSLWDTPLSLAKSRVMTKRKKSPNQIHCPASDLRPPCSLAASAFPLCQYLSVYAVALNENEATHLAILDVFITQAHSDDKPIAPS